MRKLKTRDVFSACRVLKTVGAKAEIEKVAKSADKAADVWSQGFDLLWGIFDKATEKNAEQPIYELLAGPFEKTADEVADMDLSDLFASLRQLAEENDIITFFKSVGKMMK